MADLLTQVQAIFAQGRANLKAWQNVASSQQLRGDYNKFVVQPKVNAFQQQVNTILQSGKQYAPYAPNSKLNDVPVLGVIRKTVNPTNQNTFQVLDATIRGDRQAGEMLAQNMPFMPIGSIKNVGTGLLKPIIKNSADDAVRKFQQFLEEPPAKTRLTSLLTYDQDLRRMGFTAKERASISAAEARKIINGELPGKWQFNQQRIDEAGVNGALLDEAASSVKGRIKSVVSPLSNLEENIKQAIKNYDIDHKLAKVEKIKVKNSFKTNLDPKTEFKLIQYSQSPSLEHAKKLGLSESDIQNGMALLQQHQQFNDELFNLANQAGIETNYLKNHIYQLWKEPAEKIEQVIRGLSKKPGFAKERRIMNFEEGIKLGLTPRYSSFAEYNAAARLAFDKAVANKKLVDALTKSNYLLPASQAPAGWKPITSPSFPKAQVRVGINNYMEQPYSAPKLIAEFLDQYLGVESTSLASKFLEGTAWLSEKSQNVVLSGGVGQINFYTLGMSIGDLTTALGDAVSGHPVRALGLASESVKSLLRGFVPGLSSKYELAHMASIKQMAGEDIGYQGLLDKPLKNLFESPKFNPIKTLFDEPTFAKYVWQKKIGLFENFRDGYIRSGLSETEAVKKAASLLNVFDGAVDDLGRNKDFENFLKTVFMAPRYREGLLNQFANMGKGFTTEFKNPAYALSRRFGVGLAVTLFVYDSINRKLNNGKHMWDNPPGKELELVIPAPTEDNPKRYFSIPFLPGKTAVIRRILGTMAGIVKGDKQEALKQFGGLLSIPISKGTELLSNRDYFGRPVIKSDTENYGSVPAQLGLWGLKSFSPGPVREGVDYLQDLRAYNKKIELGKKATPPSLGMSILRSAEIPLKQGSFPSSYYSAVDSVKKEFDPQTVALYNQIHPEKGEFEVSQPKTPQEKIMTATVKAFNPNVVEMERQIAIATAQKDNKEVDPIYLAHPSTVQKYYLYQMQPPGSQEGKNILKANPDILQLMDLRSSYFDKNPIANTTGQPIASKRAQALMDAKQWDDPEVKAYLDANTKWKNSQRELLGLPPLPEWQAYAPKIKKVKFAKIKPTKIKTIKIAKTKVKTIKLKKAPKIKIAKTKSLLTNAILKG